MYIKVFSKLGWKAASLQITLSESSISGTSGTLLFSLSPAMSHRNSQSLLRPMFIPDLPRLELLCPVSSRQKLKRRLMLKILSPCHKGLPVIYWLPHAYGYFSCQTRYWLTYFPHYVFQMNCMCFFVRGEAGREDVQSINPLTTNVTVNHTPVVLVNTLICWNWFWPRAKEMGQQDHMFICPTVVFRSSESIVAHLWDATTMYGGPEGQTQHHYSRQNSNSGNTTKLNKTTFYKTQSFYTKHNSMSGKTTSHKTQLHHINPNNFSGNIIPFHKTLQNCISGNTTTLQKS